MAIVLPGVIISDDNLPDLNDEYMDNNYNLSVTTSNYGNNNSMHGNDTVTKDANNSAAMMQQFFAKAATYATFKVGNFLQKYYFPVFIPIGVLGRSYIL